jgi:hypothetical protein
MMQYSRQRGSIFGLDARVALIIFSFLTLVSGYTGIKAYAQVKAQGFAAELRAIAKATAQVQTDLGAVDCSPVCPGFMSNCDERRRYERLISVDGVDGTCSSRWHGPYITPHAIPHPHYGIGYVFSYTSDWGTSCTSGEPCYYWMLWTDVDLNAGVLEKVNDIFDGANEGSPDTSGVFRWVDNTDGTYSVQYRLTRAIN